MAPQDNYQIQLRQAQALFLGYDQEALIAKLALPQDESYLYPVMFSQTYRLHRATGRLERLFQGQWIDANTHEEGMTLLDLICDSRDDRHIAGRWKNMSAFGLMFHQNLAEDQRDPWALAFDADPEGFAAACQALGGRPLPTGDVSYAIPVFEQLELALILWRSDEEFGPSLRWLWDENALQYLKYETMYFARIFLIKLLKQHMGLR